MDKTTRNTLRNTVTQCRRLLETAIGQELAGRLGIYATGAVDNATRMGHLLPDEHEYREQLLVHLEHIEAGGFRPRDAVTQLVREVAFTHLNRLVAYKMMEARELIREAVSRGAKSQGFLFYLADHSEDEVLWSGGQSDLAYQHFLTWLGASFADEIPALFSLADPANRLYPPQRTLEEVLALLNDNELAGIWTEDETIGWVYQYFTPKELRDQARKESQAPRNSCELAFRNQFYTPRYVVGFLSDNTLGRIWYEMCKGQTRLTEACRYMVRRKHAVFMKPNELPPAPFAGTEDWGDPDLPGEMWTRPNPALTDLGAIWRYALTVGGYGYARSYLGVECGELANERRGAYTENGKWQGTFEELRCCLFFEQRRYRHFGEDPEGDDLAAILALHQATCERWDYETEFIPHRPLKDPRDILMLDPACGSLHFGLYCFDLYERIYDEAWELEGALGPGALSRSDGLLTLRESCPDKQAFLRDVPRLIIERNIHGIDIDPRACQIAALALWLRAQRAYQEMGLKPVERPKITKANVVCAEPMPGERELLDEFTAELNPPVLRQLVTRVFEKMKLAGEAGSLLRIEDELRDVIASAKAQWAAGPRAEQLALWPDEEPPVQLGLFDLTGISDEAFWQQAEGLTLDALKDYAEHAAGRVGLRRRLFADDAAQGFAFIGLCRKRYDVTLMNPPFGEPSYASQQALARFYPTWNQNLLCAFIERSFGLLGEYGKVGAIFDRTAAVKSTYADFRRDVMLANSRATACADLGWEVLEANVETTSMTWSQSVSTGGLLCCFFDVRLVPPSLKGNHLLELVGGFQAGEPRAICISPSSLLALPNSVMGYDMPEFLIRALSQFPSFKEAGLPACTGAQIRSEQHFRLSWECPLDSAFSADSRYCYLYNGGEYQRFFLPPRDVALFGQDGEHVNLNDSSYTWVLRSRDAYYKAGVGFGVRGEFLDAHYLRQGYLFTVEGQSMPIAAEETQWLILGLLNSSAYQVALNSYCGQHKYSGYVNLMPITLTAPSENRHGIAQVAQDSYCLLEERAQYDQTTLIFRGLPWLLKNDLLSLESRVDAYENWTRTLRGRLVSLYRELDARVSQVLGIVSPDDLEAIRTVAGRLELAVPDVPTGAEIIADLFDYFIGVILGRWDVRLCVDATLAPGLSDPPLPYPRFPPGILVSPSGYPATSACIVSEAWLRARPDAATLPPEGSIAQSTIPDSEYPLRIDWDGILVDDPDHPDDIVGRVRDVLEVLWGERAGAIEQEACEILGADELRDYFRKPGAGGFWLDHVRRYSKSRRKAPIYWLLQSSKKNYGLWLYYHRLDRDLLFKALVNYVEPKIRLEEGKLEGLREQRAAAGTSGREAKQLERQIEHQESFLAELHDFHDKLRRAADLGLEPDLNDGVILNIAPLWELVPWKEAKATWDELVAGKYEWSSIGKQLRAKGLVQ